MKIKSLLLGSAAALVAVSSAQAADAIIVEPEPIEYVKVCDMYGAGYFYIPGTETCLRISGHVRIDYRVASYHEDESEFTSNHDSLMRGRVGFTAKNETEHGTLGSDVVLTMYRFSNKDQFSETEVYHSDLDSLSGLTKATINLAGFRMGYDGVGGSAWHRYGGYGYYNARNDGLYYEGGAAGMYTAMFFEYGGTVGSINYVVGIQDSTISGTPGAPDLYVGMTTAFSGLSLGAIAMWDSNGGLDSNDNNDGSGGIAYKIRADYDLSSFVPGGSIGAWWMADHGETDYVKGHAWGVTMKANLTDSMVAFAGYSAQDLYERDDDIADWTAGVRWNLVPGMWIQAEWNKRTQENGFRVRDNFGSTQGFADSRDRFNLRFFRSF